MTKYVIDLPDNVSFIVGKGYVLFNEKEFLRIPVKQLEKYSKKEDVEAEKDEEIVYDGRKEENMSDKYLVSQEFMSNLKNWKRDLMNCGKPGYFVGYVDIGGLPACVYAWLEESISNEENNNRLIAIIRWVNGEDVFEVEKPKKWVVRSNELTNDNEHYYVSIGKFLGLNRAMNTFDLENASRFDTKEEAESWANAHQEVVEVDE